MRLPASLAIATLLHASLLAGAPHLRRPQATAKVPVLVAIVSPPSPPVAAPLIQPVAAAPAKPTAPRPPRINAALASPSPPAASNKPATSPEPPAIAPAPVVAAAPVAPASGSEGIEGTSGHGGAPGGTGTSTGGTTGEGHGGGGSATGTGHTDGDIRSLIAERIRAHRRYPSLARRRGIEGTVGLSLAIRPDGSVDVAITRSADPMLDEAARAAARAAAPLPPIAGRIEVDLAFRLVDE